MSTYHFTTYLAGLGEMSDEDVDRLYAAGCDDRTPVSRDGEACIAFSQVTDTLDSAIRSAIRARRARGLPSQGVLAARATLATEFHPVGVAENRVLIDLACANAQRAPNRNAFGRRVPTREPRLSAGRTLWGDGRE